MSPDLMLLRRPDVQDELHMTIAQQAALSKVMRSPIRIFMPSQNVTDAEQQIRERQEESQRAINETLNAVQRKRLNELSLQWRGVMGLADPTVANRLKISGQHRMLIARIAMDFRQQQIKQFSTATQSPSGGMSRTLKITDHGPQADSKLAPLRSDTEKKILGILTPAEKSAYQGGLGKPFTFRRPSK